MLQFQSLVSGGVQFLNFTRYRAFLKGPVVLSFQGIPRFEDWSPLFYQAIHFSRKHLYILYFVVKPILRLFSLACLFVKIFLSWVQAFKKVKWFFELLLKMSNYAISTGMTISSSKQRSRPESMFAYAIVMNSKFYQKIVKF